MRIRPPRRAWSLLNTSLLATPYLTLEHRRHRLAGLLQRDLLACPVRTAQAKIFAFAPPSAWAVVTARL